MRHGNGTNGNAGKSYLRFAVSCRVTTSGNHQPARGCSSCSNQPALSAVEGPALSAVEGPALSAVEGPALSAVEGPALSAVEGFQLPANSAVLSLVWAM